MKLLLTKGLILTFFGILAAGALIQPVLAEEDENESEENTILTVELNDAEAASAIKSQLVEKEIDETLYPGLKASIDIDNSEILLEGLDISKLGIQDVMVHLTMKQSPLKTSLLFNSVISEKLQIEVVDTTAPVITLKYEHIRMEYEEELDPMEWIEEVTDNSDINEVSVSADMSQLDNTVPGEYQIIYTATDASGNTSTAVMGVEVKQKKVAYSYYGSDADSITTMLQLMNNKRAEYGLSALTLGDENAQAAIGVRACEAATNVSHTRPDGRHYKTAFDDYGVSYSSPYEILTYSGSTVQDKFNWWMGSSSHRADILRSSSTKVAIGYCGKMWAAIIYE